MITEYGNFKGIDNVLISDTCPINLLSQSKLILEQRHIIEYENGGRECTAYGPHYILHFILEPNSRLYELTKIENNTEQVFLTKYSKDQLDRAKMILELYSIMGHPCDHYMCQGLSSGTYENCDLNCKDLRMHLW